MLSHDEISYLDKPAAASEERGKRKSVQISDGKQLDKESEGMFANLSSPFFADILFDQFLMSSLFA